MLAMSHYWKRYWNRFQLNQKYIGQSYVAIT